MDKECTILWLFIKIMSKASKKLCFWILMKKTLFPPVFPYHNTHRKRDKKGQTHKNNLRIFKNFSTNWPKSFYKCYIWILTKHWTVGIHTMHREGKTHLIMWAMMVNSELHMKYKLNKNTRSNFFLLFFA